MSLPRLLLVEDDASIRRFVALALEDHALDLVQAPTLRAAIDALRSGPFEIVLCDLMLPDGSGYDLLQSLAGADSPSPRAHRVAFSAGVSAQARQRLQAIGVHEVLAKPASLRALADCVQRGLSHAATVAPAAREPTTDTGEACTRDAVERFFGGNRALYDAYLAQCRVQWRRDAAQGERALADVDLPALRRLAHSLKSVLLSLGLDADSALAKAIELDAADGRGDAAWAAWPRLQERLIALADGTADATAARDARQRC